MRRSLPNIALDAPTLHAKRGGDSPTGKVIVADGVIARIVADASLSVYGVIALGQETRGLLTRFARCLPVWLIERSGWLQELGRSWLARVIATQWERARLPTGVTVATREGVITVEVEALRADGLPGLMVARNVSDQIRFALETRLGLAVSCVTVCLHPPEGGEAGLPHVRYWNEHDPLNDNVPHAKGMVPLSGHSRYRNLVR